MTIAEAKAQLRAYGVVKFRGVMFAETRLMVGNWEKYTGRYHVTPAGASEPLNTDSLTIGKAFELAKPHFRAGC